MKPNDNDPAVIQFVPNEPNDVSEPSTSVSSQNASKENIQVEKADSKPIPKEVKIEIASGKIEITLLTMGESI